MVAISNSDVLCLPVVQHVILDSAGEPHPGTTAPVIRADGRPNVAWPLPPTSALLGLQEDCVAISKVQMSL
jgi:hypothetical protein